MRLPRLTVTLLLAVAAVATAAETTLKYNDDAPDGKQSLGGSGEMIQFELPKQDSKIAGLRIHGARYGSSQPPKESFLIFFLSEDRSRIIAAELAPLSLFGRGDEKWVTVILEKPISVPQRCWIALDFRAGPTKGVYVSYDISTGGKHSLVGLPGTPTSESKHGGDWMIEAVLSE